jgi:3-phenylpropionate/cinnamic acid dioxygenase small subunit
VLDLAQVSDRIEIADLLTRYTRAIDTGDWDRLDDVFLPDAHIDYSATGGLVGRYPEVKAWLAQMLPLFPRRQHVLGQSEVTLAGDTAGVVAYFVNPMVFRDRDGTEAIWEFGGYYHHALVRSGNGWRSRELVEELVWKRGVPG